MSLIEYGAREAKVIVISFEPIHSCVFPVAGMGTRFLPATKNIPKEMLPLLDRPVIHYGVDEATQSGCSDIVFVTSSGKGAIREYFSDSPMVLQHLRDRGEFEKADEIQSIASMANFHYIVQPAPKGLGDAVSHAEGMPALGDYFGLVLPDDVILAKNPVLLQLDNARKKFGGSVLAIERVPQSETHRYGIIDGEEVAPGVFKVNGLVEKPDPADAPSNLAIVGRYVLSKKIFSCLREIAVGQNNEYQLTDALQLLLSHEPIFGVLFKGDRLDCGTVPGWIEATLKLAVQDASLKERVQSFCASAALK